jgi:hypothetical protein
MNAEEYNIEYFKCIRDEITKRIQLHYRLLTGKIAIIGGVLAYLARSGTSTPLDPFLTCSILGFFLDVAMLENLGWIRSAGAYVRRNIETGHPRLVNWERDFAQKGGHWACFHPWGYRFGVWSISAVLFCIGFYQVCHNGLGFVGGALSVLGLGAGIYTWMLVRLNLGRETRPIRKMLRLSLEWKGPPMSSREPKDGDESPVFMPEQTLNSKSVEFRPFEAHLPSSPSPPEPLSPPET